MVHPRVRAFARALACSLLLCSALPAQGVHYTLRVADADARVAEVTARFPTAGKETLELFLPVWSPGFYRVENYHRNVLELRATNADGGPLAVEKPKDHRWRIA